MGEGTVGGLPGVRVALGRSIGAMGVRRTARTLLRLNQPDGFDCPGCAWPDPSHAKAAEFCENGAKHVAAEATRARLSADFFRAHPVDDLAGRSDRWLEAQGRLTEPMLKREGADRYEPVGWDEALGVVARRLNALRSADQAVFYTSGRTSNEAAFAYQLFARAFGTNNLPDCSNLCHESTGAALSQVIGVGKGSCTLDDLEHTDLILVCGQNPGTNHPRMLTHLERAKRNGATIVAVNPLPERGLLRFDNPQTLRGLAGRGRPLADRYLQIRLAGDQALFLALGKLLVERGDVDRAFIEGFTDGFDAYASSVRAAPWEPILAATGLARADIEDLAGAIAHSESMIICWAMGLTQHRNSVPMIRELVNLLLLRGDIGKRGAGVFPVRGHSNVQGDRTMGISEKMPEPFLDALGREFGFVAPRTHGWDAVASVAAMRDGRARALVAMGGNLVRAMSDTSVTEAAVRSLELTVSVATKLNRSHAVCGRTSVILPTLSRSERDVAASGRQRVTVEDSIGMVHASEGVLPPASPELRSEVWIVCELAQRTLGAGHRIDWRAMAADYDVIRGHIERVVPGFDRFNERIRHPGGFLLPHPPRDERRFTTDTGRAHFTCNDLRPLDVPPGRLILQTIRSHDQFNTTVYSDDDRYRGVQGNRRVIFVNPADLASLGLHDGDPVDIVSEWPDGVERVAAGFQVVAYPTAAGCAAAYFPEANVLVPLDSVAEVSNTPTSKSVIVRLEKPG